MGEIRRQTLSGVKWTAIETIALRVIQFAIGVVLARLLTPSDYGLLGMIAIFIAVASSFVDSGMGNALVRKKDAKPEDLSTVFYFNIVVSLLGYAVLFLAAPLIARFFNQPALTSIVRVVALNLVIGALGAIQGVKFTIDLDFKTLAKISTTSSLLSGGVGIALAYLGYGVWALVFQSTANAVFSLGLKWLLSKWRPLLVFSKQSFHELFGYGSKLLASSLLHTIYINLTTLLIGKFYTPKALGFYSRGESFPSTLAGICLGPVTKVTFPILAKLQDDDNVLVQVYRKYIKASSMLICFMLILLAALAKPIVLILLTDKWSQSIPYMQIFCFAWLLDHVCQLNLNLLQVKGRSDLFLRLEIIKKSISLAMLLAAVPFGVMAICIMRLIYCQIAVFINTYYTGKLFNLGFWEQVKDFGPYIVYSIIACLPGYFLSFTPLNNWAVCIMGFLAAVIVYWLILLVMKDSIYQEYARPALAKIASIARFRK